MIATIDIKNSVTDKILYFLNNLKDDVKIVKDKTVNKKNADIEAISKDDEDYNLYLKAKEARKNGEKKYPLDLIISEYI